MFDDDDDNDDDRCFIVSLRLDLCFVFKTFAKKKIIQTRSVDHQYYCVMIIERKRKKEKKIPIWIQLNYNPKWIKSLVDVEKFFCLFVLTMIWSMMIHDDLESKWCWWWNQYFKYQWFVIARWLLYDDIIYMYIYGVCVNPGQFAQKLHSSLNWNIVEYSFLFQIFFYWNEQNFKNNSYRYIRHH